MDPYRDSRGRFMPGHSYTQGRRTGAKHRIGTALLEAIANDFESNGTDVIARVREERPVDYLKICLSVLPKDMTLTLNPLADLSDEDLHARLQDLDRALEEHSGRAREIEGGTDSSDESCPADHLQALPAPK